MTDPVIIALALVLGVEATIAPFVVFVWSFLNLEM